MPKKDADDPTLFAKSVLDQISPSTTPFESKARILMPWRWVFAEALRKAMLEPKARPLNSVKR